MITLLTLWKAPNAGIVRFGPLVVLYLDDWRAVVEVNLTGTFVPARAVARRIVAAGSTGAIVTVTSLDGVAAGPNAGAYGATKAGIARLTTQMALEWGPKGIRCNAVAPWTIASSGLKNYPPPIVAMLAEFKSQIPGPNVSVRRAKSSPQ